MQRILTDADQSRVKSDEDEEKELMSICSYLWDNNYFKNRTIYII